MQSRGSSNSHFQWALTYRALFGKIQTLNWIKSPRALSDQRGVNKNQRRAKNRPKKAEARDAKSDELGEPVPAIFPQSVQSLGQNGVLQLTFQRFTLILGIVMPFMHFFKFCLLIRKVVFGSFPGKECKKTTMKCPVIKYQINLLCGLGAQNTLRMYA